MSRAAYDSARAEYIKSHSRAERLRLAWLMVGYVHRKRSTYPRGSYSKGYHGEALEEEGYNLNQLNAFCSSINAGLTCPTLYRFSLYPRSVFIFLFRYVTGLMSHQELNVKLIVESSEPYAPESNPAMVLRAAFRELEHALITLPRTTISKKETVADATHSS